MMLIADRFEVDKEIGRGGIGVVYKAFDKKANNRPVVIKILIDQKDDGTRDWVERHFLKEAKALKLINHPGVVQLIDVGKTTDNKAFFAMEYIDGYDLRSQIDPKKGLVGDYERVAKIISELCDAISAAHERGIYHRDLKPENVMLKNPKTFAEDEQVKVIDFGIATVKESFDEKTKTTQLLAGSLHYMAPEQLENRPSASSDIYSLGAIAYEMVTGRPPFMPEAQSYVVAIVQLMQMQKEGVRIKPKDLRPSLPEQAQVIILKALAFEPENRYKVARNFGNDLARALTNRWDENEETSTFIKETQEVKKQFTKSSEQEKTLIEADAKVSNVHFNDTKSFSSESINPVYVKPTTKVQFSGEATNPNTLVKPIDFELKKTDKVSAEVLQNVEKTLEANATKIHTVAEESKKGKLLKGVLILVVVIILSGLTVTLYNEKNNKNNTPQPTTIKESPKKASIEVKEKTLKYWMLWSPAGKNAQPPIRLTDEINSEVVFKDKDEIEFFISSPAEGYFYILHEPEKLEGKANYTILFPSPNNPTTKVKEEQVISTKTSVYGADKIEKIWFIWSSKEILGLEQAFVRWKGKESLSEIEDPQQEQAIKELLGKNSLLEGISIKKETVNKQIKVLSNNDPLIYSIILKRK